MTSEHDPLTGLEECPLDYGSVRMHRAMSEPEPPRRLSQLFPALLHDLRRLLLELHAQRDRILSKSACCAVIPRPAEELRHSPEA